ncbi:MAG: hypothetical protein WKG07_09630 [Hymenobacter sp.]
MPPDADEARPAPQHLDCGRPRPFAPRTDLWRGSRPAPRPCASRSAR